VKSSHEDDVLRDRRSINNGVYAGLPPRLEGFLSRVKLSQLHVLTKMAASSTELEAVLSALLVPDNEVIKQAEARLKELSKTPQFIVAITERAGMSASPQASESCRLCISC